MFSKACEYGIRACIHLAEASREGKTESLKQIAEAIDSPTAFTAKVLQLLARDGIIHSIQGPSGGYEILEHKISTTYLSDILNAIDGGKIYKGCGLGLKQCNAKMPCPLHDQFMEIRENLREMLETTNIEQLADGIHEGIAFLKR